MAIINTIGTTILPNLNNEANETDIRIGKQAINADGDILTGSMETLTDSALTPNIIINESTGLISSSISISNGFASGKTYSSSKTASSYVSNLKADNIKSGISILGVKGTYTGGLFISNSVRLFISLNQYNGEYASGLVFFTKEDGKIGNRNVVSGNQYTLTVGTPGIIVVALTNVSGSKKTTISDNITQSNMSMTSDFLFYAFEVANSSTSSNIEITEWS